MVVWACLCVGGASENFLLKTRYINSLFDWLIDWFTISNSVFNFNILTLVVSEILGGSQMYIRGPCALRRPPSVKILTGAQVLAYIYIVVNFQLRSSIHAGLTERSLYNRFALKNLPKCFLGGILGGGVKIFGGNPLGMQWPPIYVVWWKNYGDAPNTLVCTLGKEITKNRSVNAVSVTFHPCAALTPLNP